MLAIVLTVVLTAMLSSLMTLGLAYLIYKKHFRSQIILLIEALKDEVEDDLGAMIEMRVRQGFLDGIASIPSTDVLKGTTRTMAKTGADLVGGGLSSLLGIKKTNKTDTKAKDQKNNGDSTPQ